MLLISDAKIEIDDNIFRSAYLKRIFFFSKYSL